MPDFASGYPKVFFWLVNLKVSPTGFFPCPVERCWAGRAGLQLARLTTRNKTSSLQHSQLHGTAVHLRPTGIRQAATHGHSLLALLVASVALTSWQQPQWMLQPPVILFLQWRLGLLDPPTLFLKSVQRGSVMAAADLRALAKLQTIAGFSCREVSWAYQLHCPKEAPPSSQRSSGCRGMSAWSCFSHSVVGTALPQEQCH